MNGLLPGLRGSRGDPHSVPETRGLACDGCPLLACIRQRSRLKPYRYWCDHRHTEVDPSVGCDRRPGPSEPPFFEGLRDAMARAGMDGPALAAAVGASPGTVREWVAGRVMPRRDFMARIIEVLDVEAVARDAGWKAMRGKGARKER